MTENTKKCREKKEKSEKVRVVQSSQTALVASEAAIASNLVHNNIVKTYKHDVQTISDANGLELGIFKLFLVQVSFVFWV